MALEWSDFVWTYQRYLTLYGPSASIPLGVDSGGLGVSSLAAGFAVFGTSFGQLTQNSNTYAELILQNQSSGTSASTDFIVTNDTGNDLAGYGDFGINSSTFVGTSPFSRANGVYGYSNGGDLSLGTQTYHKLRFATYNLERANIDEAGNVNFLTPTRISGDDVAQHLGLLDQQVLQVITALRDADILLPDELTQLI